MNDYTVIGYYESNGQIFVQHETAPNAFAALTNAAQMNEEPEDYMFVSCIPGHLYETDEAIHFPGDGVVSAQTVLEQPEVFQ